MNTADRLREIIREKKLVQRRVAAEAGFSAQQLCDMMQGRKRILADDLPRLAAAMGVDAAALVGEERPAGDGGHILSGKYSRLVIEDTETGKEIAAVTGEAVTTADDRIVVRLTPRGD